jgi:hypothetical protein
MNKVKPQLEFNNGSLRKRLAEGVVPLVNGAAKYKVDVVRLDDFFTALSCGIIYKSCGSSLPMSCKVSHLFHNLLSEAEPQMQGIHDLIDNFYGGKPMDFMEFGSPDMRNEKIYTATIFGIPNFQSSITIVHRFFGIFKVTSMLTLSSNGAD